MLNETLERQPPVGSSALVTRAVATRYPSPPTFEGSRFVSRAGQDRREPGAAAPARPPRFYSVAETAALLRTCSMTVYRAINAGEFPAVKIRGRYVIPARAIDQMEADALTTGGLVDAADYVARGAA